MMLYTRLIGETVEQIETTSFDKGVIKHMTSVVNFQTDKKGIQKDIDYVEIDGKMYMVGVAKIWDKK